MRTAPDLYPPIPAGKLSTAGAVATYAYPPAAQRSPWQSPVPYLFGGLAAMMGLIAFALLILACSYWKLSGDGDGNGYGDEKGDGLADDEAPPVFEEKFLVIMAGDVNPTFLATPVSNSKASVLNNEKLDDSKGKEQYKLDIKENGDGIDDESSETGPEQSH